MKDHTNNRRQNKYQKVTSFNLFAPKYVRYAVKYGENLLKNALIRHKLYIIKAYCRVPCTYHIERGGKSS
jgi:hypothetical protein